MSIDKDDPRFSPSHGCGHCHFFTKAIAQALGVDSDQVAKDREAGKKAQDLSVVWPLDEAFGNGLRDDVIDIVNGYEAHNAPVDTLTWHQRRHALARVLFELIESGNERLAEVVRILAYDAMLSDAMEKHERDEQMAVVNDLFERVLAKGSGEGNEGSGQTKH